MSVRAISSPNIALVKYWGNRHTALRLPAADSLSITLSTPTVTLTVDHADSLKIRSYTMGEERPVTGKHLERFAAHIAHAKTYLATLGIPDAVPSSLSIDIDSHIPPSVGLASSAAVFSCLAQAIRQLIAPSIALTDAQTSVIARLGSGSACRSVMGGFVAMEAGNGDAIDAAFARQIADAEHWMLYDFVIIPTHEEKKVGSTEGHAEAQSSPLFAERVTAIHTRRQQECINAIMHKDFEKLRAVSEEDMWDMHRVMQSQSHPLNYLSDETHRIVRELEALRTAQHMPVLYTMDAGPTVHAICTEEAVPLVQEFAEAQQECTLFLAHAGSGSRPA
jgi:diphosphomevalonate decarboxylase